MESKTWHDLVFDAILSEGGIASLSEIYAWFEREVPSRLYESWKQAVRRSLLDHTSDSEGYKGGKDLFYSVKGIGSGVWGIQLKWLEKEVDFDFHSLGQALYELDESELAERVFNHAVSVDAKDKDSRIGLAKAKAKKGQLTGENALEILQSIISEDSESPEGLLKLSGTRTRRKGVTQPPTVIESAYTLKKIAGRMNRNEAILVKDFSEWIYSDKGVSPVFERDYEDIRFILKRKSYSIEAKYVKGSAIQAVRSAIGQLLYYNTHPSASPAAVWVVLIQSEPTEHIKNWIESLRKRYGKTQLPLYLCWKDNNEYIVHGTTW